MTPPSVSAHLTSASKYPLPRETRLASRQAGSLFLGLRTPDSHPILRPGGSFTLQAPRACGRRLTGGSRRLPYRRPPGQFFSPESFTQKSLIFFRFSRHIHGSRATYLHIKKVSPSQGTPVRLATSRGAFFWGSSPAPEPTQKQDRTQSGAHPPWAFSLSSPGR